jgi:hypothetical protein
MILRNALILGVVLAVAGCGSVSSGVGSGHNGGIATYDDLKEAQQSCAAKGGHMKLKRNGDPQYLEDYACEKGK